uniref:Uncharacterized protein n=1 Tax=Zea mays TaxID=4577 RepID=C4J7M5_MAIZE|nr:unknown [Zea mays]
MHYLLLHNKEQLSLCNRLQDSSPALY